MKLVSLMVARKHLANWKKILAAALLTALLSLLATLSIRESHISAQDFPAAVGRIEGDDIEVATSTPTGIQTNTSPTVVASGSDVTVRSGHALLMLNAGGEFSICGPAHFKLIKSSGALTLALDYGRVHASMESSDELKIYTPTIVATPIAIAGAPRDTTVGLGQNGEMCVLTARGAMRVEPQFSDQSMIVPQGGAVSLAGGQIESLQTDPASCSCDYPGAHMEPSAPIPAPQSQPAQLVQPGVDVGALPALSPPVPPQQRGPDNSPPPSAPAADPVYTVLMPPLSFDAHSPVPPPQPAPEAILLAREVRLRPSVEFRGRVNAAPAAAVLHPAPRVAPVPTEDEPRPEPGLLDRVRTFWRKLTSANAGPCAGFGCSG